MKAFLQIPKFAKLWWYSMERDDVVSWRLQCILPDSLLKSLHVLENAVDVLNPTWDFVWN